MGPTPSRSARIMRDKTKVHHFCSFWTTCHAQCQNGKFLAYFLSFFLLLFPAQDHVDVDLAGPHDLAAGRCADPVPAVVAVHTTTGRTAPGSRLCPAAAGSPPPAGQGPPDPVPGLAASVRRRVQPVPGRATGGRAQWIPRHQGSPRQVRRRLF